MVHGQLTGKVALVTGASSGIGQATAVELAAQGAYVAIAGRNADRLAHVAKTLPATTLLLPRDLSIRGTAEELAGATIEHFGRLDILINNAATVLARPAVDSSDTDYDYTMNVNVYAPFATIRAAIPHMLHAGGGAIVNVASMSSLVALPQQAIYCTSKTAILGLTRAIAAEYASQDIRCNAICPGTVETPMLTDYLDHLPNPKTTRNQLLARHPIGRFADPTEIARVIAFLAGPDASFVHGAIISVDGGYVAT
jgi:NAD(P)-dependent dehydrogenase (short-subunit alcohol dehydrogenase family)